MKLGKTAQAILARLHELKRLGRPEVVYTVCSGLGRGPHGGKYPYGHREAAAAASLVRAGLAVVVSSNSYQVPEGRGYVSRCHELTIRLKEPGA